MARIEAEVGKPQGGLMKWIDDRFPFTKTMEQHVTKYYAAKSFNWWYVFGVLAMVVLVIQLLTGIFLTMNYKPAAADAFASVEYIMRDVEWGWLIRYMHSTGASFFFIVVYLHMFRAMLYGSYQKPRELIWLIGMLIFLVLMAEAFAGYLLPWGQMSYWGAQVIISLFGAIPVVGDALVEIIRGDYSISDITLNRFFALHVIVLPLALIGLIFVHIVALHEVGSNNPDGIDIKKHKDETGKPLDGGIPPLPHVQGSRGHYRLPDDLFRGRVLCAGYGRLLPRARKFCAGKRNGHARAHRAGLVLHAVLRDTACRSRQTIGLHPVCSGGIATVVPAVARSKSSAVHPLPRLDVQDSIDHVRHYVLRLVVPWPGAG
jgi:hypothetical protein